MAKKIVPPRLPLRSSPKPIRTAAPAVGQYGHVAIREKFECPNNPIAAIMRAFSTRAFADLIPAHSQWILVLESFDRCIPTVGHVRVGGGLAGTNGGRAHAARDGFVIGEMLSVTGVPSSETQIFHC